jgi:hypothetical protein
MLKGVAAGMADNIKMVDVAHPVAAWPTPGLSQIGEAVRVECGQPATFRVLAVQVGKLDAQNRGLHFVEAAVDAPLGMVIAVGLAVIA